MILLWLLTAHFIGDFVLQSNWMGINKSTRWDALALHVAIYALCFCWTPHPAVFMAVTFASHFLTDAVTSRITSRLWFFSQHRGLFARVDGGQQLREPIENPWMPIAGKRRWFFVAIGADQLIHAWTL